MLEMRKRFSDLLHFSFDMRARARRMLRFVVVDAELNERDLSISKRQSLIGLR